MNNTTDIIKEIKETVSNQFSTLRGIYLFGSVARADASPDSDIDVALVFDEHIDWNLKDRIRELLFEIMLKYDVIIDSQIYITRQIKKPETPFRKSILSEGIYYGI